MWLALGVRRNGHRPAKVKRKELEEAVELFAGDGMLLMPRQVGRQKLFALVELARAVLDAKPSHLECEDSFCPKFSYRVDNPIRECDRGGSSHQVRLHILSPLDD